MDDEIANTTEDEAQLADLLTQAVVLAERLLETKHTIAMRSLWIGGNYANPLSATLRALLTAREEFALFAQGAYQSRNQIETTNLSANESYLRGADEMTAEGRSFPTLVRVGKEADIRHIDITIYREQGISDLLRFPVTSVTPNADGSYDANLFLTEAQVRVFARQEEESDATSEARSQEH